MAASYLRSRKAKQGKSRASHGDAQSGDSMNGATPPRRQLDGSKVTSPPGDPVNSEETLKRNQKGNS